MPELPEVETVRRGLAPRIEGRRIESLDVFDPRLVARSPLDPQAELPGSVITSLRRRAKWLLADLDSELVAVLHLRMSGQLLAGEARAGERAPRMVMRFEDGTAVRFVDQRRFGELLVVDPDAADALEKRIGPEADTLTTAELRLALGQRTKRVKAALVDQTIVGGVGNMYADEALWRAGIHPDRTCDSLSAAETRSLASAVRSVLRTALSAGGTSTRDGLYVDADGNQGWFAVRLDVYQREGEPCRRCGSPVVRITHGATASRLCPQCQK